MQTGDDCADSTLQACARLAQDDPAFVELLRELVDAWPELTADDRPEVTRVLAGVRVD